MLCPQNVCNTSYENVRKTHGPEKRGETGEEKKEKASAPRPEVQNLRNIYAQTVGNYVPHPWAQGRTHLLSLQGLSGPYSWSRSWIGWSTAFIKGT
ncbi:Toll-Like Receptor 9 [Manis pentadactyla]|nr:Toll-Like Receptor 9 [Manis pentadactyla]